MYLAKLESILLFLVILFLPTQLGRHFWPEFAFVYSLPIDYLSPTIYFWDVLAIALCIFFILQKKHINRLALNLFYFFILTQTLSLLPNFEDIGVGLVRLEQYLIAGLFGVYLASSKFSKIRSVIFWALALSILGESILAIVQFIKAGTLGLWILGERSFTLSTPAIAKFDFYGTEFLRPYATFPHPNVLAAFMIIGILLIDQFSQKGSFTKTGIFIAASVATIMSFSRVSIITLLVVLVSAGKRWILFATLLLLLTSPFLYARYYSLLNFDKLAYFRREELLGISLNLFKNSPIFGVGLNKFIIEASDEILIGSNRFLQPVHNIFLLALSETGIIGFIGLISLIGYPIFRLLKLPLNSILLLWGIVLFLGLFDHYFLTLPQGQRMLFLIWGVTLSVLE